MQPSIALSTILSSFPSCTSPMPLYPDRLLANPLGVHFRRVGIFLGFFFAIAGLTFADPTPVNGKITFLSDRDGQYEIYIMNADGSNQTRLTYTGSPPIYVQFDNPTLSPNGAKIVFAKALGDLDYYGFDIYVMDSDGSNQVRLTNSPGDDYEPDWSPDGTKILFSSRRDGDSEIYLMNADGSSQVNLTHSCGEDLNPAWAPDGTQIVFESDRIDPNLYDVFVMNADGSGQQSVTRMADPFNPSLYNEPKWSPDGRKIAFTPYSWYFDIWTINPDGSDLKRLTHNSSAVLVGQPSWSTDGSKIIYTANLGDGWGNWEIYTVNADGSGPVNLTHNPGIDLKPHCQKRLAPSPPSPTPSPTSAPAPTPVSTDDTWTAISLTNAPDRRHYHTAVWTGSEMIVWGGYGNGSLTDGARYNPNSNTWAPISTTNAPSPTERSTAIWTGSEMIVWGSDHYGNVAYGGRYDPKTDTWTSISSLNAPRPRSYHTAVWTGTEMIVWGGHYWSSNGYPQSVNTGGRYNPTTDTWIPTSTVTVPTARSYHTAIWNGNEMIVWGGDNGFADSSVNTGGRYNPVTDTWIATPSTNAPDPRQEHTAVWTGNEMIVWGGVFQQYSSLPAPMNTGAKYNPVTNNWITTSTINSPQPRYRHRAVWTGYEMIVWGGQDLAGFNSGSRYNPLTDTWAGTSKGDSPHPRQDHTAIWTGSEMIIWGGENLSPPALNTGARYNASQPPPPNPLGR